MNFLARNAFPQLFSPLRDGGEASGGTCCKMQLGKATNASGTVHMEILSGGGSGGPEVGQPTREGGRGRGGGRHYLCKGVERSLWNCGARLVRPCRFSMARENVSASEPLPTTSPPPPTLFPALSHPMTEPLPATLSPGVTLKYLGGAVA